MFGAAPFAKEKQSRVKTTLILPYPPGEVGTLFGVHALSFVLCVGFPV